MHYNRDARRVVRPMETEGLFMEVSETENKAKTVKKRQSSNYVQAGDMYGQVAN